MKINTNKLVYKLFASMLILVLFTTWLMSGLLAKYTSGNSASGESEVALWKIDAINDTGEETTVGVNLKKKLTDSGDNGSWYFGIQNESDVSALLDKTSTITIEILSGPLDTISHNPKWAFLNSTNPITISASLINDDINNVIFYKNKNDNSEISIEQYTALSNDDKVNYVKTEKAGVVSTTIFQTADSTAVTKGTRDEKVYYFATFNLSGLSDEIIKFYHKGDSNFKNKTFKLTWSISGNVGGSGSTGEESTFYNYSITNVEPSASDKVAGPYKNIEYTYNGEDVKETLYVKKTGLIFSDYFLFNGGEPTFTIDKIKKPFSILSDDEIDLVKERASNVPTGTSVTYEDIRLYTEALAYKQYEDFMKEYSDFAAAQGYIQCGLTLSVVFNIKVVQAD